MERPHNIRRKAIEELHEKIIEYTLSCEARQPKACITGCPDGHSYADSCVDVDTALWKVVIAYQNYPFCTSSGLPFSYIVKCKKNGEYSGELIVSRKEDSKTLTRSSVLLAFHTVLESITIVNVNDTDGNSSKILAPSEYRGPKAIGQIFGISYVYSLFWKWGLIRVPEQREEKLKKIVK